MNLRIPNPFSKRRLTRLQKAERVSPLCVASQDIGHVRKRKVRATINGLRACVDAEVRARFDNTMALIEGWGRADAGS